MNSAISSSASTKFTVAGGAERLLLRMLLVSLIMFIGCLSACVGSITVFIFRVRGSANDTGDIEACRKSKRKKRSQRKIVALATDSKKNDPANIAEQACNIAFERMGFAESTPPSQIVARGWRSDNDREAAGHVRHPTEGIPRDEYVTPPNIDCYTLPPPSCPPAPKHD